jgi:ADP-ribose pyrophosphatase YjhB (NUDIX family)
MAELGVTVAIIQSEKILLIKREDYEVWCLPGGMVDNHETIIEAAIREAYEETGLVVEFTRLVGVYSRIGGGVDIHTILLKGNPVGGELQANSKEILEIRFFHRNELPEYMFWWHKQQISDTYGSVGGSVVCTHRIVPPINVGSRRELYELRDRSGLSRFEFYRYYFESNGLMITEREISETNHADVVSNGQYRR